MKSSIIPEENIQSRILFVRGKKVMLDKDLSELYGIRTKVLSQAVKRNLKRFPQDFMFRLTEAEKNELVTICDRFAKLKHSSICPLVFTEQGVAMLSSVLNSERAIGVNIWIMRTFAKLREILSTREDLRRKIEELESKYDRQFKAVFDAIKALMFEPVKKTQKIGFKNA